MEQTDQGDSNKEKSGSSPSTIRKWLPAALIVAGLAFAWAMGWFEYFSLSSLIMQREALAAFVAGNLLLGLLGYMAVYAGLVAISFPGASLLTILSGFLFGGILGGLATVFAATAGAVIIFLIARSSFGETLAQKTGGFVRKMVKGFQEDSFSYLLTLRLMPVFPFWVMNIVPAVLNMKLLPYTIATFLGIIPGTFAYAYIGAGLDSVIAAQEKANPGCAQAGTCEIDISALITTEIIIAMVGLAIISILPTVIRKIRGRKLES